MATFQFTRQNKFDFLKSQTWEKWFQRFETFQSASRLAENDQAIQINSLIYCMGSEADDILDSLTLTINEKKGVC